MSISVSIRHRLGAFELDAAFESQGRLIALFGPSGSGKTSIVNAIGGLTKPNEARIVADGCVLVDTASRIFLPSHRRRIGYVFQDARLFPHMSVFQNLRYGRFFTPKGQRYADIDGIVDLLGIDHLLERMPGQLSGGEKQRVAIGRALVASPKLILMDEPLASLDEARKAEILPYIERLRDEARVPIVYVSHAISEVARLASNVVMMAHGRVTSAGSADEVLRSFDILPNTVRPPDIAAAVPLVVEGHDEAEGLTRLRSAAGIWRLPKIDARAGESLRAIVQGGDVLLSLREPRDLSALNVFEGRVLALEPDGPAEVIVRLDCAGDQLLARITRHSTERLKLDLEKPVFAVIKAVRVQHG